MRNFRATTAAAAADAVATHAASAAATEVPAGGAGEKDGMEVEERSDTPDAGPDTRDEKESHSSDASTCQQDEGAKPASTPSDGIKSHAPQTLHLSVHDCTPQNQAAAGTEYEESRLSAGLRLSPAQQNQQPPIGNNAPPK